MRQEFRKSGRFNEFMFEPLTLLSTFGNFDCGLPEYNDYLFYDALRSLDDHIALTWLLTEQSTGKTAAYMSLITDAIKLTGAERNSTISNTLFIPYPL